MQNLLIKTNKMFTKLYIILLNIAELTLTDEFMETLVKLEELCLIIPSLNNENIIKTICHHYFIGRNENKGIILASTETLYAKNVNKENIIRNSVNYCNRSVLKIQLDNCSISHDILNDVFHLLADSGRLQLLEISNSKFDDALLKYFSSQFYKVKKESHVEVKCLNLSFNKLTRVSTDSIITLLKCWKTEELFITNNDLSTNGLWNLIQECATEQSPL